MSTRGEIANLFHRYADYIDSGKFVEVAELFKDCTVSDGAGTILASGKDQVLTMYQGLIRIYPDTGTPKTQHVVTNLIVAPVDPSGAVPASANFTVMQQLESGSVEAIICGKYNNLFKRMDGQWRFVQHSMEPRIIGDMSQHLLLEIDQIEPA